ncbi:DUF2637 domain-containing protein [Glycomyces sp. NPDC048151]|uniref:DUF2637 domain-containing protein n=1 Tax=Glycomyces sp. NPDC048151 TaxID=3364002 RepID=UPI0037173790
MNLTIPRRAVLVAATIPVAGVAAAASYHHIHTLAAAHGQPEFIAATLPLSVDGMILSGSYAMTDGRTHRGAAWATFMVGVVFSLAANILVADPDLISRVISAFPSISLLLTVEVLIRSNKVGAVDAAAAAVRRAAEDGAMPELVAELEAQMPVEAHAMAALLAANDTAVKPEAHLPEGMFWIAIQDAEPLADAVPEAPAEDHAKKTRERQRSLSPEILAQVRDLLNEDPEMSDEEIGERIGRAPRTVTGYRKAVQQERPTSGASEEAAATSAADPIPRVA